MPNAHDVLFKTLADPTRRAIFERLCREGEQTVGALTAQAGISQGGLEASRGPETGRTGARPASRPPDALQRAARRAGPAARLDRPDGRLLAKPVRRSRRPAE